MSAVNRRSADFVASRARAREESARKVDEVLDLMSRGEWGPALAVRKAREWGLEVRQVTNYAIMAGHILRHAQLDDLEAIRANFMARYDRVSDAAMHDPEHPNYGAAVRALDSQVALVPGLLPQKAPMLQIGQMTISAETMKAIEAEDAEWEPLQLAPNVASQRAEIEDSAVPNQEPNRKESP